ncbi:hypothetical protein BN946_scf184866.g4 [Trametes cinnabarina]|uniref:RRM domain-containing protein n=1 Tax=Pycnoporus cinnabarinus TaxID=5643 RepID=A0A060SRS2_PYCCI|nr:hypothetical protein BN946_scf184866.g4 [Trametes cinnabarina]
MAKTATAVAKPAKLSKKKSEQDLKADAPVKAKKAKQTEDAPAAKAPSTKSKKEQKGKAPAMGSEVVPPSAKEKRGKKKEGEAVSAKTEVGDEKKRKAAAVEKETESTEKSTKKRRGSVVVHSAPALQSKAARKGKAAVSAAVESEQTEKAGKKTQSKPAAKAPSPDPEEESAHEGDAAEEQEQEEQFYGFESDDDDSSDDEMPDEIPGIDIKKLPTISKDDEVVKRKLEKAKRKPTEDRGVVYLGRIPHGFYEDEMRAYFSQFGTVTRLRLSRNKKTGKSKHYAFIEFDSSSVAQIVAETMDNYLLMGHILTCKVIPKDQVHPELWVGANRKWRPVPRDRVARVAHNKPRTEEEQEKAERRLLKRQEQRKRKLQESGIDYDFEAVAYKKKPKPTEA